MAKETMRAVNQAEQKASETVQQAKEESERLRREAAVKGEQLIASAVKEAKKRAEILYGVAKADGENERLLSKKKPWRNRNNCGLWPNPDRLKWPGKQNGLYWAIPEGGESVAVVPMKRLELYGLKRERKAILEYLQSRGAVEVHTPEEADDLFAKTDTSQAQLEFDQNIHLLEQAVELLDQYAPVKKSMFAALEGRTPISQKEYDGLWKRAPALLGKARELTALGKQVTDCTAQILRLEAQLESLKPWMSLDIPLDVKETANCRIFIGSFPEDLDEQTLKNKLAQLLPQVSGIEAEVLNRQAQQTCVFCVCHKQDAAPVRRSFTFVGIYLSGVFYPAAPCSTDRTDQGRNPSNRTGTGNRPRGDPLPGDQRRDLLLASDYYSVRAEKYEVLGNLWQSPHVFFLTGYVTAEDAPQLLEELETKFTLWAKPLYPGPEEKPPVKLKNGFFTAPMESVVAGYSLPGKYEIDPSSVMALLYYVLFGLMLSDAAYGILTMIGCGVALAKFKNMEVSLRKTLRMFFFCGISTTVWGILFGSYFGDCIPVIARTFFNTEITIPALWFEPLDDPMRLLLFSFALGIVHLFTGLGVQFYQLARRKMYADALYDVVFWYLLVGGLIVLLLSTEVFVTMVNLPFRIPSIVGTVAGVLAAIGAVGIVCTAGRESRNPVKRLLKGLYGLYNVSGYLSDVLSYSRLLALGLATGVIAHGRQPDGQYAGRRRRRRDCVYCGRVPRRAPA